MRNETRILLNQYTAQLAQLNGVPSVMEKFVVAPTIQQKLEERIQLSSEFLKSINVIGMLEKEGEKLGMDAASTIAGRTDTSAADRVPREVHELDSNKYRCEKTDFDTAIKYSVLDVWAKFQDFQTRLRDLILKRQALDRIMIGFNGISVAATTNRVANPLLQDVNKGWIQHYREQAAARVMNEVIALSGAVNIGATGDYKNLDALVLDARNNLVDATFRQDPSLVVICGTALMADKYFPIVNKDQTPENMLVMDMLMSQKRIGGLPGIQVPFIPEDTLMITPLRNLSIYWQEGSRRRTVVDNAKRDQIENYESSNEAYVVEDFRAGCVVENIVQV